MGTTNNNLVSKVKHWHPFVEDITKTSLSKQWETFTLDWYDGSTDPNEHVSHYITQVILYSIDGVVMCKAFPTTLRVRLWNGSPPYLHILWIASTHFGIYSKHSSLLGNITLLPPYRFSTSNRKSSTKDQESESRHWPVVHDFGVKGKPLRKWPMHEHPWPICMSWDRKPLSSYAWKRYENTGTRSVLNQHR